MYKLKIDVPGLAKGAGVQIAGIGTFENGDTDIIITDEEHEAFRRYHGQVVPITDDESGAIVGSELRLGPTLIQANLLGIEAEVHKESAAEKKAREAAEAPADDKQEGDES